MTAGEDGVKGVGELDGVTEGVSKLLLQGDVMGRIIGKKGATIKEIREKSGATVDVRLPVPRIVSSNSSPGGGRGDGLRGQELRGDHQGRRQGEGASGQPRERRRRA